MTMFELVATGPQADQRWRQTLEPGRKVRIGRAPAEGWAVSWDMRISREHCDLLLEGDRLKVRCLDSALNPAHLQGQALREFSVGEGESFRIGATTFHLGRKSEYLSEDDVSEIKPAAKGAGKNPSVSKHEGGNSSIRRLKAEVEELKARLAAEAEAKQRKDEEKKPDEVALLKAELERIKAQVLAEPAKQKEEESRRQAEEEARKQAEREARRKAEEEARRQAEEARKQAEEDKRKAEAEARKWAEEESRRKAEEEARRKAEEEARRRAEEEARKQAEEEARRKAEEEARQRAEEEARKQAEEEARRKAEEEARRKAEEEARRRAEEEARQRAEEEARRKAEEEARKKAEEEAQRKAREEEAARRAAEAKRRAEEAEAKRLALEAEARRLAEEAEALRRAEEEAERKAVEEARKRAEEEARKRAEDEARRKAEEEARRKAEEEARVRAAEEAAARHAAEMAEARRKAEEAEARRRALEEEARRLAEEAEALRRAEEEAARKAEEEARLKAEQIARELAEAEARRRAEDEARQQAEAEARRRAEEEAAARRAAEHAEMERKAAEAEAKRLALEEEARRLAEEAAAILQAEEEARLRAEEESRERVSLAARQRAEALELERRAEESRLEAEEEEAKRQAAEDARRLEEEAARRQVEDQQPVQGALETEPPEAPQSIQTQNELPEVVPASEPTPSKPSLAELKAKMAADSAAKKKAKQEGAQSAEPKPPPSGKPEVAVLKEQLAAQAAAKRAEKGAEKAAAEKPAAAPVEPGKKKLDIAAIKAELEAKKAARQKSQPVEADAEVGRDSEVSYEEKLGQQLNRKSVSEGAVLEKEAKGDAEAKKPAPAEKPAAVEKPPGKPAASAKGVPAKEGPAKGPIPKGVPAPKGKEVPAAASGDSPQRYVWQSLSEAVRERVRKIAAGAQATSEDKREIAAALNKLLKDREFLAAKVLEKVFENERVAEGIRNFPKGVKGIKKDWSELEIRAGARLALQVICPTTRTKKRKRKVGPPRTLAYLSRSEIFGEMGALLGQPRSATCVAYDHPPDDSSRKPGRVELVRIGADVFQELIEASPGFRGRMEQLIAERQKRSVTVREERPWDENSSLASLPEFQQLGLVQGQKLMLIDLDRCTRCGDCVRACINTHEDGYSRLFLDGPRFDRFLVPSACRKCLNPSCMIGCPVGSIQRGDNDEILIRDWCIGCGLCARQCPYDSIQMHDLGVIPEKSLGWRFQLAANVTQAHWNQQGFRDADWPQGQGPFPWDLNLQLPLARHATTYLGPTLDEAVYFRLEFEVPKSRLQGPRHYRLFFVSSGSSAQAWVNGQEVDLPQDAKQKKKGEYEGNLAESLIRPGKNLVAVAVQPPISFGEMVLSLRLDMHPELTGDAALAAELKLVTERAVVCDLCGTRPGGPACVAECPHDAALRVDAQREFPRG